MAVVEQRVSDQLHSILGLSDRYVTLFLVNMAQKSSSRQDLVEKIRDTGTISVDDDVVGFVGQLWDKHFLAENNGSQLTSSIVAEAPGLSRADGAAQATRTSLVKMRAEEELLLL